MKRSSAILSTAPSPAQPLPDGYQIIELGHGKVKLEPCHVSEDDQRQALLFEPVSEPHAIGLLTGDPAGPHVPAAGSVLVILGSVESATVLLEVVQLCIDRMLVAEAEPIVPQIDTSIVEEIEEEVRRGQK